MIPLEGWIAIGTAVVLMILYGGVKVVQRSLINRGKAEQRAETAEGDEDARKRVEEQRGSPRSAGDVSRWMRRKR
jgi:hypothetical protein